MPEREPTGQEHVEIEQRPMFQVFLDEEAKLHLDKDQGGIASQVDFLQNCALRVQSEFLNPAKERAITGKEGASTITALPYLYLSKMPSMHYPDSAERDAFLARLFRYSAAHTIEEIKDCFEDNDLKRLFNFIRGQSLEGPKNVAINMMRSSIAQKGGESFQRLDEIVKRMIELRRILKGFVIEQVPSEDGKEEKLPFPFDKVDMQSEEWQKLTAMSRCFGHAMSNLFSIAAVFEDFLNKIVLPYGELANVDDPPVDLHAIQHQLRAIYPFLQILTGYQKELLNVCDTGEVNVMETLFHVEALLNSRMSQEEDNMPPLPIEVDCDADVRIKNVDSHKFLQLCLELAKGAFDHKKVTPEQLHAFRENGKPYLCLKAINEAVDGVETVVIVIADKGAPFNFDEIRELSLGTVQTYEQLTDFLTQKGTSVQVGGDDGKEHKGLGTYVSRRHIQGMNGDLSFQMAKGWDAGIVICIPTEGTKSKHTIYFRDGNAFYAEKTHTKREEITLQTQDGVTMVFEIHRDVTPNQGAPEAELEVLVEEDEGQDEAS